MKARIHSFDSLRKGPYIGPKGGLYADPAHTIPWNRKKHGHVKPSNCPRCKGVAHIISRQTSISGKDVVSSAPCRTCNKGGKHPLNAARAKKMGLPIPQPQAKAKKAPPEREQPAKPHQMKLDYRKPQQQALFRSYSVEAYPLDGYLETPHGLRIAVETGKGSKRRWMDPKTREHGETVMVYDYGFLIGQPGYDGDELDVYVGPNLASDQVFVINQRQMKDKRRFDEHKVMLGFDSEAQARAAYLKHYDEHGEQMLGSCTVWSMAEFKKWLAKRGAQKGPA